MLSSTSSRQSSQAYPDRCVAVRTTILAAALCAAALATPRAEQLTTPLLVDRDVTVGAGATLSTAIGEAVAKVEDTFIPHRLFDERGVSRRLANISYRLLKFAWFDTPQEQLLLVANHELFGHGARLRERFDAPIGYRIDAPVPYGRGGGSTSFVLDREPSSHEWIAISIAGMEVDAVGAALIAHRGFVERRMRPRDAIRYLAFELDTFSYVRSTDDEGEEPGHDVNDFLEVYNGMGATPEARRLTAATLRRDAFTALANPMLAYALFGIGRYLWNGDTDVPVPALSIAGVRYLPMLRYRLAPYGREWSIVNELAGRIRPTEVELRIGRSAISTPWALRVHQNERFGWGGWSVHTSGEVWRQPRLDLGGADSPTPVTRFGVHVRARAERAVIPLWFSTTSATAIVEIGGKSSGYVPGEPLAGGLVIRAGAGLPLGR